MLGEASAAAERDLLFDALMEERQLLLIFETDVAQLRRFRYDVIPRLSQYLDGPERLSGGEACGS